MQDCRFRGRAWDPATGGLARCADRQGAENYTLGGSPCRPAGRRLRGSGTGRGRLPAASVHRERNNFARRRALLARPCGCACRCPDFAVLTQVLTTKERMMIGELAATHRERAHRSGKGRNGRRVKLTRRTACCTLLAILTGFTVATEATADEAVTFPGGPLTGYVGERGECQSSYVIAGRVAGNYFPGGEPFEFSPVGDCGFFLAFPEGGAGQATAP